MSGYGGFAFFYDRLTENVPYKEIAQQIEQYVENFGGRKNILLDLACGTGTLAEEFASRGFDVIGVDSSEEMLGCALEKKFDSGNEIQYIRQDMRAIDMYGTIDVTICTLDSLNHLSSAADVLEVFKRVSLFCEAKGLFIFDLNTLHKHRDVLGNNSFIYSYDDLYCGWQNEYDNSDDSVHIYIDIFWQEENEPEPRSENEVYGRYFEDLTEIYISREELMEIINSCGFELLAEYDGYSTCPPTEDSERIVYVCRKI